MPQKTVVNSLTNQWLMQQQDGYIDAIIVLEINYKLALNTI